MLIENFKRPHLCHTGDKGIKLMPYSEVCMHMQIAGKVMAYQIVTDNSVQLYDLNGKIFSFPIGYGEAGFYKQTDKFYYYDAMPEGEKNA